MTLMIAPWTLIKSVILLENKGWHHLWLVMYSTQTMVCVQIHIYISRPKYIRLSPDCPLVIFSYIALSFAHCFILYSSAFAQHCIITHCCLFTDSTCLYYYHQPHPQVLPLNYTSLSTMQPLPAISSELQHILLLPLMWPWELAPYVLITLLTFLCKNMKTKAWDKKLDTFDKIQIMNH